MIHDLLVAVLIVVGLPAAIIALSPTRPTEDAVNQNVGYAFLAGACAALLWWLTLR